MSPGREATAPPEVNRVVRSSTDGRSATGFLPESCQQRRPAGAKVDGANCAFSLHRANALEGVQAGYRLITQRSSVQIRPPQPKDQGVSQHGSAFSSYCPCTVRVWWCRRSEVMSIVRPQAGSAGGDGEGWIGENEHRAIRIRHTYTRGVAAVTRGGRTRRRKRAADAIRRYLHGPRCSQNIVTAPSRRSS